MKKSFIDRTSGTKSGCDSSTLFLKIICFHTVNNKIVNYQALHARKYYTATMKFVEDPATLCTAKNGGIVSLRPTFVSKTFRMKKSFKNIFGARVRVRECFQQSSRAFGCARSNSIVRVRLGVSVQSLSRALCLCLRALSQILSCSACNRNRDTFSIVLQKNI